MSVDLKKIVESTRHYNLHAHSQFCDGRNTMQEIARAAREADMKFFAFTPHSPICVESTCNMDAGRMKEYLELASGLRDFYAPEMSVLKSLEIDYVSRDFGPHIDYFRNLPLDFQLGSVHFVPNQDGIPIDCDGRYEHFAVNLKKMYGCDLRYVVEKYFEQVLNMLEQGGVDLLGHFDKIAGNASCADSTIEDCGWYESLIDDVISHVKGKDIVVEINTKAFADKGRFYPAERWWPKLIEAGLTLAVDSDTHYATKVEESRGEAFARLDKLRREMGSKSGLDE